MEYVRRSLCFYIKEKNQYGYFNSAKTNKYRLYYSISKKVWAQLIKEKECDQIDFDLYFRCTECGNRVRAIWYRIGENDIDYNINHCKIIDNLSYIIKKNSPEIYCEKYRVLF